MAFSSFTTGTVCVFPLVKSLTFNGYMIVLLRHLYNIPIDVLLKCIQSHLCHSYNVIIKETHKYKIRTFINPLKTCHTLKITHPALHLSFMKTFVFTCNSPPQNCFVHVAVARTSNLRQQSGTLILWMFSG